MMLKPAHARVATMLALFLAPASPRPANADAQVATLPTADTYVDSSRPNSTLGSATEIRADGSPVNQAFLRFTVSSLGPQPLRQAILRLTAGSKTTAASDSGGTLYLISSGGWSEAGTSWNTRPAVDGPALGTQGAVKPKQVVDFDVTSVILANTTYNFALVSSSTNGVRYRSREASSGKPQLLLIFDGGGGSSDQVGYEDFSYGSSSETTNNRMTGEKPESKLWYHDGFWWATLYEPAAGACRIHWLDVDSQTWVDTGVFIDERSRSRQDVLWDGQKLYALSRFGSTAPENRLRRYGYDASARTWVPDSGFPAVVPGGGTEAATIAKDSTGRLWTAYTLNSQVLVSYSVASDAQWSAPFVLPVPEGVNVDPDDIAGVVALPGQIGVFWSNQLTDKFYFAVHADGAQPSSWQQEIAAAGGHVADDHLNLKLASDGRLFVAVKTSRTKSTDTLVGLLVRSAAGAWSPLYPVTTVEFNPTRPICLLDETARRVYVFYSPNQSNIYYKTSDLDSIVFPGGIGTPFIFSSTIGGINNPTSTKQSLDASSGLVVLASSPDVATYWHNTLDLAPPAAFPLALAPPLP
jgi:hypothetical protein